MEEYIKDAILANEFTDLPLIRLVELTVYAIQNDKPLYPSPLDEPVFFRKYFYPWVREALKEKEAMEAAQSRNPFEE